MRDEGYESVFVLGDGLQAWLGEGLPTVAIDVSDDDAPQLGAGAGGDTAGRAHTHAFLPGLVEKYVNHHELPLQRQLCVLFVDIADSTNAIVSQTPEDALAFVQRFMSVVTDAALAYCGDVKDYEGDGALLYFESVAEATQAALAIRDALSAASAVSGTRPRARLSLDVGDLVIGVIGTPLRSSVALIGPTINRAARLLKQVPPQHIIATQAVVEQLRQELPALAERFALLDERLELKGFEQQVVTAYSIPPSVS